MAFPGQSILSSLTDDLYGGGQAVCVYCGAGGLPYIQPAMKLFALLLALAVMSVAQNYTARRTSEQGVAVIRLADAANGVEVSVLPSIGNRVSEMKVHGKNILYFPSTDLAELQKKPDLSGVPFLAPWANRLNEESFWANGKKYTFNMTLGNVRGPVPIHGLLANSDLWEVIDVVRRPEVGSCDQPAVVLEAPGVDGAMALCSRI